jgi:hypothetical protein
MPFAAGWLYFVCDVTCAMAPSFDFLFVFQQSNFWRFVKLLALWKSSRHVVIENKYFSLADPLRM